KLKASFINYVEHLTEKRKSSKGNYGNWDSGLKHLKTFVPYDITFAEVDRKFVQDFKFYLDKEVRTKPTTAEQTVNLWTLKILAFQPSFQERQNKFRLSFPMLKTAYSADSSSIS